MNNKYKKFKDMQKEFNFKDNILNTKIKELKNYLLLKENIIKNENSIGETELEREIIKLENPIREAVSMLDRQITEKRFDIVKTLCERLNFKDTLYELYGFLNEIEINDFWFNHFTKAISEIFFMCVSDKSGAFVFQDYVDDPGLAWHSNFMYQLENNLGPFDNEAESKKYFKC